MNLLAVGLGWKAKVAYLLESTRHESTYAVIEHGKDFSRFNLVGLKFMSSMLFEIDWLIALNMREIEDKVQSTMHLKSNGLLQFGITQNQLSTEMFITKVNSTYNPDPCFCVSL